MADDKDEPNSADSLPVIEYHYIKSQIFRVIHADGALGGITPRGLVHLTFYNERAAIPRLGIREFDEMSQTAGPEKYAESKAGIVRELEFDVLMDETTAHELRDWLNRRLEDLATMRKLKEEGE